MLNKRKIFILIDNNIFNKDFFINKIKKYSESKHNYFIVTSKINKVNHFWNYFFKNNKNVFFVTKYNKFLSRNNIFKKIKKTFVFFDKDLNFQLKNKIIFNVNIKQFIKPACGSLSKIKLEKIIFCYIEKYFPKNLPVVLLGRNNKNWKFIEKKQKKKKITIKI